MENYKLPKLTRMQAVMLMRLITCEISHQEEMKRLYEKEKARAFVGSCEDAIDAMNDLREQLHEQGIAYYQELR